MNDQITKTAETEKNIFQATGTRRIIEQSINSDGYNLGSKRSTYEDYRIVIISKATGKSVIDHCGKPGIYSFLGPVSGQRNAPAGAVASLGDGYIGQQAYDICTKLIAEINAELETPEGFAELKAQEIQAEADRKARAEENINRMAAEHKARQNHPGWCNRCQSYCYGDCRS